MCNGIVFFIYLIKTMKNNYGFNDFKFFTEMSELASRHHSFDLSLGLPDFEIDPRLRHYQRICRYHHTQLRITFRESFAD